MDTPDLSVFQYPVAEGVTTVERGTAVIGGWAATQFYDPKQRPGQDPPDQPELLDQQVKLVLTKWTNDGTTVTKTITLKTVGVLEQAQGEQDSALYVNFDDLKAWNEWVTGQRINFSKTGYDQVAVRADSPWKTYADFIAAEMSVKF